jgi:hypothetical protein
MNFYKIYNEDRKITQNFNLDIVQCFLIDDNLGTVDIYYSAKEHFITPLTNELIKKLKEIGVLE